MVIGLVRSGFILVLFFIPSVIISGRKHPPNEQLWNCGTKSGGEIIHSCIPLSTEPRLAAVHLSKSEIY